jgi:hypothetical protein
MSDEGDRGEWDLDGMAGSYRAQTGHLTRTIKKAAALVKEAALCAPSTIFLDELKRALAEVRDQQAKCADICEDIRDAQDKSDENEAHIEGCLNRDADRADLVAVQVTREMARCEIGLRLPVPPVVGAPGPNVGQVRVIFKPEKDLKPQELTAEMTPVEFAYWIDAFEAYHAGSHMEVDTIAVQQAFIKACVHSILYNRIKTYIVSGVTPVLGPGNTVMGLMRDEFLLEHSLFARRLAFFRFKQAKAQAMSNAVNDLQRLGDQSDLAGLGPEDLYVMRYLTIGGSGDRSTLDPPTHFVPLLPPPLPPFVCGFGFGFAPESL